MKFDFQFECEFTSSSHKQADSMIRSRVRLLGHLIQGVKLMLSSTTTLLTFGSCKISPETLSLGIGGENANFPEFNSTEMFDILE